MDFLGGSIRLGRVSGIDVRVHNLYLIWAGFQLLSAGQFWAEELAFIALLFVIVLLHEFGHCFGARSVGGDSRDILMWPLGGLAFAQAPMRPWPQFVTVACGPLVNVVFCLVSAVILVVSTGTLESVPLSPFQPAAIDAQWQVYVVLFYRINQILLYFNLLPIYPLDGGQLLHTILWPLLGLRRSTIVACYIGLTGCAFLAAWGLGALGGGAQPMLVGIALFGGFTCWQRLQMAQAGLLVEDNLIRMHRPTRPPPRRGWPFKGSAPPGPERNPGGWERKQAEASNLEAEVDRILQKVHDRGISSLTYIERQTLERATRARQEREEELQRGMRL